MDESARKQTNDLTSKTFFLVLVLAFSLLFFSFDVNGGNYITLNENFPNIKFYYNLSSCFEDPISAVVQVENISNADYLTKLPLSFNNNWYCAFFDGTQNNMVFMLYKNWSNSSNIKTKYGLSLNPTAGVGVCTSNCPTYMTYLFNENISLTPNTRISFYISTNSSSINKPAYFALNDNKGVSKLILYLTTNTMSSGQFNNQLSPYKNFCDVTLITNVSNGKYLFNESILSLSQKIQSCENISDDTINLEISQLSFGLSVGTSITRQSLIIDDFSFTYFNGSNSLPDFNVTFSNLCYNSSMGYNTIHTNITTYDPEGDTLYYGKLVTSNRNLNYSFDYQDEFTIAYAKNYPKNQYNDGSYCEIQEEYFLNSSKHNIVWLPFNVDNENKYMLGLTSTCSGDPEYIITLTNPVYNVNYYTEIYGLQTLNEYFNVTFYDYDFNVNARAMFKVYNTSQGNQIGVYDYNGTGFEKVGNYSIPVSTTPIWFLYNMWGNGTSNSLYSFSYTYSMTNLRNTTTVYIGLDVANGVIYQSEYNYAGIKPNIEWTTDPTDFEDFIDINSKGNYQMYYYLTDLVHYPDEYVEKHYSKYVNDCYPDGVYSEQDINNFNPETEFDPLKATNKNLGQSMKEYLAVLDTNNIGSQVLWVLYFFLFIGLYLFFYFTARNTDMTMPIVFSSMIILFLSILAGYTILSISSAIIMVFGIAIPITASLVKGSDGSE